MSAEIHCPQCSSANVMFSRTPGLNFCEDRRMRRGWNFQTIDLRWGIAAKEASGETANSWEYCRQTERKRHG